MFVTPFPYEYVRLLDPGDRVRRGAARTKGSRIRRPGGGQQ